MNLKPKFTGVSISFTKLSSKGFKNSYYCVAFACQITLSKSFIFNLLYEFFNSFFVYLILIFDLLIRLSKTKNININ